jgi:hypothetical protein
MQLKLNDFVQQGKLFETFSDILVHDNDKVISKTGVWWKYSI